MSNGVLGKLPLPQKAKRVIWLTMAGGPSQLELFDYKPKLAEMDGKPMPESFTKGQQLAQLQGQKLVCKGPMFTFQKYGKCQTEMSELLPHIGSIADEICLTRSMTTDAINHDPAHMFMNTGSQIAGRPSMGSWITYGLGSEAENLPGFVVLTSTGKGRNPQPIAARQWSSGFLPSKYQGVQLRSQGDAVLYLTSPNGITRDRQGADVAAINALNQKHAILCDDPEIVTRIAQYEMAFQMQASVPELMDIRPEGPKTLDLYGCQPGDGSFASNCLLARRLAERGTRFIQLYHRDWDHHSLLREELPLRAKEVDRACMALITDLKQRGMLDDTLIVFSGEFGRTPMAQGNKGPIGRDHHNKAMSIWLAGAGVQRGITYGSTDDLGYAAQENIVTVHDLHATMLQQLGIRHDAFTFKFQGLDAKLSGVEGAKVIKDILV
ncbi:sulfatase [Brevifollis gellanilyticus]|uniref:Sulfatase n=2 Tax=Brevifollis gellanilyticus TaxID=748831 RepID=A0A512M7Q9_9BACT|nr:sulfatase [Brevifollis gellanilyticus]